MINISQLARTSGDALLKDRVIGFVKPEVYVAENVADYEKNAMSLYPPLFKCSPLQHAAHYAVVLFNNVGIKAIDNDSNHVDIYDDSGSISVRWHENGRYLPAQKPYGEVLDTKELAPQDHVHELVVRHSYISRAPYVASFTRQPQNAVEEQDSLPKRIKMLFPEIVLPMQPAH